MRRLEPPFRERARAWARDIGDALIGAPPFAEIPDALIHGDAGIALFLAYLARATGDARYANAAEDRLARASETCGDLAPFLFSGAPGVGWVLEHLAGRVLPPSDEDLNADTDEFVIAVLDQPAQWRDRWEHMYGVAGFATYALERPRELSARRAILDRVIVALDALGARTPDGIRWTSYVDPHRPEGQLNLGLAHGVSGVITALARLRDETSNAPSVEALIAGSITGLQQWQLVPGEIARYPSFGGEPSPSRLAWCFGDLAVAIALVRGGTATGTGAWIAQARELAVLAAGRDPRTSGVMDAGFCHGALGVAHMFWRLHDALGDDALASAADRWFAIGLAMRTPGAPLAGTRAWDSPGQRWLDDPGLLGGAAGIGLSLLTFLGDAPPEWDRVFLLG